MDTKEEKVIFEQLYYKKDSKEMSVKSKGVELSVGDIIETHNKTVFRIEEIILKRKSMGKYKDESNRPDIYILKGEILFKVKWIMNQDPKKQKKIIREMQSEEKKKPIKPSTNWSEVVKIK